MRVVSSLFGLTRFRGSAFVVKVKDLGFRGLGFGVRMGLAKVLTSRTLLLFITLQPRVE